MRREFLRHRRFRARQPHNAPPAAPSPDSAPPAAPPPNSSNQNPPNDVTTTLIGAWEFSNADHDKICRFNFRADAVPGGNRLEIDKNCPNLFPSTKDIVAWAVDNYGNLRLLDAQGNAVIELTEVESGMYDGFTPEEGRYILQTAAAAPVRSADDMAGDWAIALGTGKPICTLTLANSPRRRRCSGAEDQAWLRRHGHAFRSHRLAHGARRTGSAFAARTVVAVRGERCQHLAARA